MLAIRMQRTGRKGHAQFRVIVQESRLTPTSGKVVARLGSYDPHAKTVVLDKEKAVFYLGHGAQPSDRVARLLKAEGVKLPDWVKLQDDKERTVRNADKRRSTRPDEPVEKEAPVAEETPAEEPAVPAEEAPAEETPAPAEEAPVENMEEATAEEAPAEETTTPEPEAESEKPAEEKPADDEKTAA